MVTLADVQAVYTGPEGVLWELLMGEQIHIGGFQSSIDLLKRALIPRGSRGIDLCCASGAGMRFLARWGAAAHMTGVDATRAMIEKGRARCAAEGLDNIEFIEADVCSSGLPDGAADFIWGEDAWCYVVEKPRLIAEAARLVREAGTIAFTDWVVAPDLISPSELDRMLAFMKFPNAESLNGYREMLAGAGCTLGITEDTGRFTPWVRIYIELLENQLRYDALKIIGFNEGLFRGLLEEMRFMQRLAEEGKIMQGLFVAVKG